MMENLAASSSRLKEVIVMAVVILPVLFIVRSIYMNKPLELTIVPQNFTDSPVGKVTLNAQTGNETYDSMENSSDSNQTTRTATCEELDLLFAHGHDNSSCLSRYQSSLYCRNSPYKPSAYLLSKLRSYEERHKHCGPYTKSYNRSISKHNSRRITFSNEGCKYIVWMPANGIGNRLLSMASTFLYAILTNRVLLVDHQADMSDLFCEPFPYTSWLLPTDLPLKKLLRSTEQRNAHSWGSMLKQSLTHESLPLLVYLKLDHGDNDLNHQDFYCNQDRAILHKVPWFFLQSDQYFAPSFFLVPSFADEVSKMFPEKDTVFYHLGRYLFQPSNRAWGLITRFYETYLSTANERMGIQVRVFKPDDHSSRSLMDQILACALNEKLLPQVVEKDNIATLRSKNGMSKAILITSLRSEYYQNMSQMYWTKPTMTGDVVGVYQPSHEEYQHFGDNMHNMKAWAEINLLSYSDVLLTSSRSTFGYVAQGLGGLKAWILDTPGHIKMPCRRALSMEPCFHYPPNFTCDGKTNISMLSIAPYVRPCEDWNIGMKLVSISPEL